jgi:hypothetical protein
MEDEMPAQVSQCNYHHMTRIYQTTLPLREWRKILQQQFGPALIEVENI